jgi:hypothetical protein
MSELFLTNYETGHPHGCICDSCVKRAARILRNPLPGYRIPLLEPGDLLDMSRVPWPDEILEKKKKEGK